MKKISKSLIGILSVLILFSGTGTAAANDAPTDISAKSAVLIDAQSARVIWEKSSSEKLPMASTTKIMTTLLTLESGNLDEGFVVDSDAITVEGSSMGLSYGDVVTKYALCCGMLLPSGNDAANAAAVKLAGSIESFADMMNDKAAQIGMENTSFVTPSGLHDDNHYSTAYDMALLARQAMQNENFRQICRKTSASLNFGNPPYARSVYNTNKLLEKYEYCIGVKTGFTDEAGRCLVSAAEKNGVELICVTLNDPNDWEDHIKLYEYGFSHMSSVEMPQSAIFVDVVGGSNEACSLCLSQKLKVSAFDGDISGIVCTVRIPPFVYAPINFGDIIGCAEYSLNGRIIAEIPLKAAESISLK